MPGGLGPDPADVAGDTRDLTDAELQAPVTIYHEGLDRTDTVSVGAANAMLATGWVIVDTPPAEPPLVPLEVNPGDQVTLYHPGLDRRQTVPAGAARALGKSGWVLADLADPEDPFGHETDGTLADQTIPLGELADHDTPTTED